VSDLVALNRGAGRNGLVPGKRTPRAKATHRRFAFMLIGETISRVSPPR